MVITKLSKIYDDFICNYITTDSCIQSFIHRLAVFMHRHTILLLQIYNRQTRNAIKRVKKLDKISGGKTLLQ